MISIRLPWRPRARPSATLHEIPIHSIKSKLDKYYYNQAPVCQGRFHRRDAEKIALVFFCLFIQEALTTGLGGRHTDSNQRLI
jgi:hypothetical protein